MINLLEGLDKHFNLPKTAAPLRSDVDAIVRLRPVDVRGRKGFFHTWGQFADSDGASMMGIVEFEDGTCDYFIPERIKFE